MCGFLRAGVRRWKPSDTLVFRVGIARRNEVMQVCEGKCAQFATNQSLLDTRKKKFHNAVLS